MSNTICYQCGATYSRERSHKCRTIEDARREEYRQNGGGCTGEENCRCAGCWCRAGEHYSECRCRNCRGPALKWK